MKYLRKFKIFENVQRSEKEIISESNLEDLFTKLNFIKLKTVDNMVIQYIEQTIMLIQAWCEEKFGLFLYTGEGGESQINIKGSKEEVVEEVKLKLQEVLRYCSAGKYYEKVVKEQIEDLIYNLL